MQKFLVFFSVLFLLISSFVLQAQSTFSKQDSLRGSLRKARNFDVHHYNLRLSVDIPSKSIMGSNTMSFTLNEKLNRLQLDLADSFEVSKIVLRKPISKALSFEREGDVIWVDLPTSSYSPTYFEALHVMEVFYEGRPRNAIRPPWDGGFTWNESANDKPWVTLSCQGLGASSWFPLKDHLSDEPDSMTIALQVPKDLVAVSNGRLISTKKEAQSKIYTWHTTKPINTYNISINIGDYVRLDDCYTNHLGDSLDLVYYVIRGNEKKAKAYFAKEVRKMLVAFESLFGKYPYYEDSYKLVETPYWGMEHQSCIAYGNKFQLNPFGFDFIILHESGHEWFGNSMSIKDNGEMWIHEAFTTYSEALYVEYYQGKVKALEYLDTQKKLIKNREAILGPLDVNYHNMSDADMYYKGTWFLHTLRSVVDNDLVWFATIRDFYQTYKHAHITTQEVIDFFSIKTQQNLSPIFNEYLTNVGAPTLEYELLNDNKERKEKKGSYKLRYRWKVAGARFEMPVELRLGSKQEFVRLQATKEWKTYEFKDFDLECQTMGHITVELNTDKYLVVLKEVEAR